MNSSDTTVNYPATMEEMFPSTTSESVETAQQPTEGTTTQAVATPKKIIVGNREFNSVEEALAYSDGFAQSQSRSNASNAQPMVAAPVLEQKKLGQLIFEDPDQALELQKQQILESVRSEQRAIDQKNKFWNDFYSKHSDLRGSELLVDAVLGKEQSQGRFLVSWEQAAQEDGILAAKVRQEVSKIRNVPSGGQALPSSPAVVAGASGASSPKTPAPKAPATDFVSELRNMRKRG